MDSHPPPPILFVKEESRTRPWQMARRVFSLPVVGPVVPDLVGEVTAEKTSHLFGSRVLAVEEPARGEIVRLLVELELLVGGKGV